MPSSIYRCTVTEENKLLLLQDAINASRPPDTEPSTVLARLRQIDPVVASQFQLKENIGFETPLRILIMDRESPVPTAKLFTSFIALSYCWHSDDWSPAPGFHQHRHDGYVWPISFIMLQSLFDLRRSDAEGVWIDAECINQEDVDEKVLAVASMDIIYRSARLVVIVLEDILLEGYEDVLITEHKVPDSRPEWSHPKDEEIVLIVNLLLKIFSARWFTRAWCIQEYIFSKDSIILIPTSKHVVAMETEQLAYFFMLAIRGYRGDEETWKKLYSMIQIMTVIVKDSSQSSNRPSERPTFVEPLMRLFPQFMTLESSLLSDRISIALNLSHLGLYFEGQAESFHRSQWILLVLAFAAGDASMLCMTGPKLALDPPFQTRSWLHWLDGADIGTLVAMHPRLPLNTQVSILEPSRICLDLYTYHSDQHLPNPQSLSKARNFMQQCFEQHEDLLNMIDGFFVSLDRSTEMFHTYYERNIKVLACAIESGIPWMANAWKEIATSNVEPLSTASIAKCDPLWSTALNHLFQDHAAQDLEIADLLSLKNQLLNYLVFSIKYRALPLLELRREPIWHTLGVTANNKAITIASQLPASPNHIFAVPAALASSVCSTLARMWTLEPVPDAPEGTWRIAEKRSLHGCRGIEEDGKAIVLRRNQYIVG